MSEITASRPHPAEPPPSQGAEHVAQQAQKTEEAEQAGKAEKPKESQQAAQAAKPELMGLKNPDMSQGLAMDFMNTFNTIFHEGYEGYKVPQASQGGGVFNDAGGARDFQKELQIVREFVRELNHLVNKGMEVSQAFLRLKAEIGGAQWQKIQEVLLKELPVEKQVLFQRLEKDIQEIKMRGIALPGAATEGEEAAKLGKQNPGRAMLEILKAETNPRAQLENMMLAMQLLHQEGLKESSEKLAQYLRKRWGMSEDELHRFLAAHGLVWWQDRMPREEKSAPNLWYPFLALLVVPIAMALGVSFVGSIIAGVVIAVILLLLAHHSKK